VRCRAEGAGRHQVAAGLAEVYERHATREERWSSAVRRPAQRVGLWTETDPMASWERRTGAALWLASFDDPYTDTDFEARALMRRLLPALRVTLPVDGGGHGQEDPAQRRTVEDAAGAVEG
jgi:pimeloyl-ACP methyl ester carboxylesterase